MMNETSPDLFARRTDRRFDALRLLSYAGMFALSYALFYQMCLRPSSDISIHATWATEGNFHELDSFFHHGMHCMWHVLVSLLLRLGLSLPASAALVTAACKTAELALVDRLFTLLTDEKPAAVTLLSLVAVTVGTLCLPFYNPTVYHGVGSANTWHSSTQLIAMVWMIPCVCVVAHCYDDFERLRPQLGDKTILPWKQPLLMGAALAVSLFAKPTFMQVFLPTACLYFGAMWLKHPRNGRFFWQIILCVLPSVALMIFQYLYYFGIIVPHQSSMVLEVSWAKLGYAVINTVLIQAFPIFVVLASRKRGGKSTLYRLTFWFDVMGVVQYAILGESGRRATDGNFGWGMMGAALMLWLVALPRFVRCVREDWQESRRIRPWHAIGILLLCWHLISGVYYIIYLLTNAQVVL